MSHAQNSLQVFPQHMIAAKRDGRALTRDEIASFVRGACDESWPDYQLSAMLMAICLRGMDAEETAALVEAMMNSGTIADLSGVPQPKVDKHSTGGVGDKVSIHLAPMVAACGVAVPMMSGRGLGHTGGTLDKLEAIPGFRVNLPLSKYRAQMEQLGMALIGQTKELAPADRKLYALRDVTGTVESIPLICASILSKKLAEGIDALVLDVKYGKGAFMKDKDQARELAEMMVSASQKLGKRARAVLTAMDQPLGRAVGNAVEVAECIECLRGNGPEDLMKVTYEIGAHMLVLAGACDGLIQARDRLENSITTGAALERFRMLVAAQGGDPRVVDDPRGILPQARHQVAGILPATAAGGYVAGVNAMDIAHAALLLGAGRARAEDKIDHAVGITQLPKVGEFIAPGQTIAVIHANSEESLIQARAKVAQAITFSPAPVPTPQVIDEVII